MEFEQFLQEYPSHLDDKHWLSKSVVCLAELLQMANKLASQAKLDEARIVHSYLTREGEKRMAVSEAEKRAVAETNNTYQTYDKQAESIKVMIDALKVRVSVL